MHAAGPREDSTQRGIREARAAHRRRWACAVMCPEYAAEVGGGGGENKKKKKKHTPAGRPLARRPGLLSGYYRPARCSGTHSAPGSITNGTQIL